MIIHPTTIIVLLCLIAAANQEDNHQFFDPPNSFEWQFESSETMSGVVRAIVKKVLSVEQAEGVGARVRRSVGRPEVKLLYSV